MERNNYLLALAAAAVLSVPSEEASAGDIEEVMVYGSRTTIDLGLYEMYSGVEWFIGPDESSDENREECMHLLREQPPNCNDAPGETLLQFTDGYWSASYLFAVGSNASLLEPALHAAAVSFATQYRSSLAAEAFMSTGFALCDDRWGTTAWTIDFPSSPEDVRFGAWGCYASAARGASGLGGDFDVSGFFDVSVWGVSIGSNIFNSFGPDFLNSVKELVACGTWHAGIEKLQC